MHSQSCHLSSTASRDSFRLYPCVGHLVTFVFPLPSKIDSLLTCVSRMILNKFHKCSIYLKNLCLFEFKCMIMSISKFCREKNKITGHSGTFQCVCQQILEPRGRLLAPSKRPSSVSSKRFSEMMGMRCFEAPGRVVSHDCQGLVMDFLMDGSGNRKKMGKLPKGRF